MNAALNPENSISTISPADVQQKRLETLLLDVRTPAEFEEAHIDGSAFLICRSGNPRAPSCREAEIECIACCAALLRAGHAFSKSVPNSFHSAFLIIPHFATYGVKRCLRNSDMFSRSSVHCPPSYQSCECKLAILTDSPNAVFHDFSIVFLAGCDSLTRDGVLTLRRFC
jgi:hypothetical protein